jgi:hypothetical protein
MLLAAHKKQEVPPVTRFRPRILAEQSYREQIEIRFSHIQRLILLAGGSGRFK